MRRFRVKTTFQHPTRARKLTTSNKSVIKFKIVLIQSFAVIERKRQLFIFH